MNANPSAPPMHVLDYAPPPTASGLGRWVKVASLYLAVALLGAGACGLFAWALLPRQYVSSARIYLEPAGITQNPGSVPRGNFLATEAAILENTPLPRTPGKPANVHAEVERKTDLIRVTVTTSDPTTATPLAFAVVGAYAPKQPRMTMVEPPSTARIVVNRPVVGLFGVLGAGFACLALHLFRRKRNQVQLR